MLIHIMYQILKTILSIFKKRHGEKTDNSSIKLYVNEIENRITFKIKRGCYLELLTPDREYNLKHFTLKTMKLLGNTKIKITKNKNGENVPHLLVVLIHCNIVNNHDQHDSRVLYTFIPNNFFCQLLDISTKKKKF